MSFRDTRTHVPESSLYVMRWDFSDSLDLFALEFP
jgi:hypothetical protein